ncbi:MAG: glucose-6-phosphate isomerase, partial [Clostridiales bacterium]|nr:glucose-6-phosphate isomerase [Clostridiales bacterium]
NIKEIGEEIRDKADVLLVLGIGGSYLGAKAFISSMKNYFDKSDSLEIIYAGNQLNSEYLVELLDYIEGKSVYVNVISKSGTTIETAIAFRILRKYLEERFPEDADRRIIATTDIEKGALRKLSDIKGYRTLPVPDDIGGRYSIFTSVGLLPIAAAGIDIDEVVKGLKAAIVDFDNENLLENTAYQYAVIRNIFYSEGKKIELFVNHHPKLVYLSEWFKQLFGESEGKDGKGIFPASVLFSTDLHSLGQIIQEGERTLFETFLNIEKPKKDIAVEEDENNYDGLNEISKFSVDDIDKIMLKATKEAHFEGNVPYIDLKIKNIDAFNLTYLMYFFMKACAMGGYLLDVNPFNQPGVEAYKSKMKALLKK